jgi:hypothetical protein
VRFRAVRRIRGQVRVDQTVLFEERNALLRFIVEPRSRGDDEFLLRLGLDEGFWIAEFLEMIARMVRTDLEEQRYCTH